MDLKKEQLREKLDRIIEPESYIGELGSDLIINCFVNLLEKNWDRIGKEDRDLIERLTVGGGGPGGQPDGGG